MARKITLHFTDARTLQHAFSKDIEINLGNERLEAMAVSALVYCMRNESIHPCTFEDGREVLLAIIVDEKGTKLFINPHNF